MANKKTIDMSQRGELPLRRARELLHRHVAVVVPPNDSGWQPASEYHWGWSPEVDPATGKIVWHPGWLPGSTPERAAGAGSIGGVRSLEISSAVVRTAYTLPEPRTAAAAPARPRGIG